MRTVFILKTDFCRIIIATINQVHVFSFPTPARRLLTIETRDNPLGLCEITPIVTAEKQLLIFPGHKLGSVQLVVSFNQVGITFIWGVF